MTTVQNQFLASRIVHHYKNISKKCKKDTVRHFFNQQIPKSTIYCVIRRFEKLGTATYRKSSGRPLLPTTKKLVKAVQKTFIRDPNLSVRRAAAKLKISKSYLHSIKTEKLGIKTNLCKTFSASVKDPVNIRSQKDTTMSTGEDYGFFKPEQQTNILILDQEPVTLTCTKPNSVQIKQEQQILPIVKVEEIESDVIPDIRNNQNDLKTARNKDSASQKNGRNYTF